MLICDICGKENKTAERYFVCISKASTDRIAISSTGMAHELDACDHCMKETYLRIKQLTERKEK